MNETNTTMKTKIPTKEKRALLILETTRKHIKKEMKSIATEIDEVHDAYAEPNKMNGEDAYSLGWYRAYHDILTIIGQTQLKENVERVLESNKII